MGNVAEEADVERALDVCRRHFGRLDVVINCAGLSALKISYESETHESHSLQEFRQIYAVSTFGTFNVNRLAVGLIGDNQPINGLRGLLINTASMAPADQPIGSVAYSSSSGAIVSMTLPLARDLSRQCIRCVTIEGDFRSTHSQDLTQNFGHLVQRIIENPMINGNVVQLDSSVIYPVYKL